MQFDHDFIQSWEKIVNDVDKVNCPIEFIKKIVFKTSDRKQKTINLKQLRRQGFDDEALNNAVQNFIKDNDDLIATMEFVLDVKAVAETIQPQTDKLLNNIK